MNDCCLFLRGEVFISEYKPCASDVNSILGCGGVNPLRKIGNVSEMTLFIESEVRGLRSKTNMFEDLECSQTIINSVRLSLRMNCINEENLKLALYGSGPNIIESGSIQNESVKCGFFSKDSYIKFKKFVASNVVVDLVNDQGVSTQTMVDGEDYKSDKFGLEFLKSYTVPIGGYVSISYDYDNSSVEQTEILKESKGPFTLYFKGINLNGKTEFNAEIYKVHLQPASSLELISQENFQNFNLTGTVMRTCNDYSSKLSQYVSLRRVKNESGCS